MDPVLVSEHSPQPFRATRIPRIADVEEEVLAAAQDVGSVEKGFQVGHD